MTIPQIELNITSITAIITAISLTYSLVNEKSREFILRKLNLSKSRAELKKDETLADEATLDAYINRFKKMNENFDLSMEMMTKSQKENLDNKLKIYELENEIEMFKQKVRNKCSNDCLL